MKDRTELARGWFAKAESDLAAAHQCLSGQGPYDTVCFHAQQTAEKYMKGFLAFHGQSFPYTHSLENLARLCQRIEPSLQISTAEIIGLTDYATALRYDPDFWPSRAKAAEAVQAAERVRAEILGVLPPEVQP